MRKRRTVSSIWVTAVPGLSTNKPFSTIVGAKIHIKAATMISAISRVLSTPDARRQAFSFSLRVSKPVNMGINAEPKAPPAVRLNSSSVTRLAALKESRSAEVPNAPETTMPRKMPIMVLKMYANMTTEAARAICLPAVLPVEAKDGSFSAVCWLALSFIVSSGSCGSCFIVYPFSHSMAGRIMRVV